jgi:small subunit ribosomal protein S17
MDQNDEQAGATPDETSAAPSTIPTTAVTDAPGRAPVAVDTHVWVPEHGKSRMRTGRVVSNKMEKTVIVGVDRLVRHRLYKKIIRRTNKFVAHDELQCQEGDVVRILETRPMSKTKRWRVVEILSRSARA